ncbi:hypothetical protein [Erwinia tasmaniensis]|uniref:hypothetical protein n=1 Tax=Erwinia tasmaniensis TaxID=338565 RepID=UPI003A4DCD68
MTKAYITKYALTKGIYEAQGRLSEYFPDMFIEEHYRQHHHGNDWHITLEDAISRAEEMRIKKLQSLDKQMKKLSALKFEIK